MKTEPTICVEAFHEKKPYIRRIFFWGAAGFCFYVLWNAEENHNTVLAAIFAIICYIMFTIGLKAESTFVCSVCKSEQPYGPGAAVVCSTCGARVGEPFVSKQ
jgi:hypothetical protein